MLLPSFLQEWKHLAINSLSPFRNQILQCLHPQPRMPKLVVLEAASVDDQPYFWGGR
ncbi:hypothetical protein DUNSADRAFT_4441 [Dunaliella salina]|uniref:Encoded protein n=1 Tax=Dunaliella salina TaxID=3046 RepID=A0ABQ7GS50_DUNSA|nr:hypothetical protein DUNSADRAFT_4441 [Dunaliella salina]|eukprot:KAF5837393.1 hypothetical protein DUNSADRAFT_4441 [Dunaliella salina]